MNLIMLGDVVGDGGTGALLNYLPSLKKQYAADTVIVNGENSAQGNGILPTSAKKIFDSGADCITTGNHVFKRREIYEMLDEESAIIRPLNFSNKTPGKGIYIIDRLRYKIAVINLMGVTNMEPLRNPFEAIDEALEKIDCKIKILDFHAETTSEKKAMGFYLDGRVSLVVGTHTHIQTADEQILPQKTGYITDLGMCGPYLSVLGVNPQSAIRRFLLNMPTRFENVEGPCEINGIFAKIDDSTGFCTEIERINLKIK